MGFIIVCFVVTAVVCGALYLNRPLPISHAVQMVLDSTENFDKWRRVGHMNFANRDNGIIIEFADYSEMLRLSVPRSGAGDDALSFMCERDTVDVNRTERKMLLKSLRVLEDRYTQLDAKRRKEQLVNVLTDGDDIVRGHLEE